MRQYSLPASQNQTVTVSSDSLLSFTGSIPPFCIVRIEADFGSGYFQYRDLVYAPDTIAVKPASYRITVIANPQNTSDVEMMPFASFPAIGETYPGRLLRDDRGDLWNMTALGWIPANGRVSLASNQGALSGSPVSTISNATSGIWAVTGGIGSLTIPAGMIVPGVTELCMNAKLRRRINTATVQYNVYVGTAGDATDSLYYTVNAAATNNLDTRISGIAGFPSSTKMTTANYQGPGSSAGAFQDRATNINTAADMKISFGITSGNILDFYDLVSYNIWLQS